ncbi:hypothetical protein VCHA53O466_50387 [Vibrio chagasii]|nr:hypothetical protein VCHA53O466_50387 [Vibrio chagasii]
MIMLYKNNIMMKLNQVALLVATAILTGCDGTSGGSSTGGDNGIANSVKKVAYEDLEGIEGAELGYGLQGRYTNAILGYDGNQSSKDVIHTYGSVKVINPLTSGVRWDSLDDIATIANSVDAFAVQISSLFGYEEPSDFLFMINNRRSELGRGSVAVDESLPNMYLQMMVAYDLHQSHVDPSWEPLIPTDLTIDGLDDEYLMDEFVFKFHDYLGSGASTGEAAGLASKVVLMQWNYIERTHQRKAALEKAINESTGEAWVDIVQSACDSTMYGELNYRYEFCDQYDKLELDEIKQNSFRSADSSHFIEVLPMLGGTCNDCSVVEKNVLRFPRDVYHRYHYDNLTVGRSVAEHIVHSLTYDYYGDRASDSELGEDGSGQITWLVDGLINNLVWLPNISFETLVDLSIDDLDDAFEGRLENSERTQAIYSTLVASLMGVHMSYDEDGAEVGYQYLEERHATFINWFLTIQTFNPDEDGQLLDYMIETFDQAGFQHYLTPEGDDGEPLFITWAEFKHHIIEDSAMVRDFTTLPQVEFPDR